MTSGFLFLFLCAALLLCGFLTAICILKTRSVFATMGMTFVFGHTVFLLLANGLGYLLPIQNAFLAAFGLILMFDLVCGIRFLYPGSKLSFEPVHRGVFWFMLGLIAFIGFVHARFVGSDPWSWQHFPLAATISAGNFPVMTPIDPLQPLAYHYAPAFLAAGFHLLTGVSLAVGFALQPLTGATGILCFVFAIVFSFTRSTRSALLAALLALAGTGLTWLKAPELLAFAHSGSVAGLRTALGGIATMVASPLTVSPLHFLGHRSTATGFPLMYGFLWCASLFFTSKNSLERHSGILFVAFVFALGLTLTMELAFATISIAMVLTALVFLLKSSTRAHAQSLLQLGCISLVPSLIIGTIHGGVLSGVWRGGAHSFLFHPAFQITYDTYGNTATPWSWQFLRDFGFPLFALPFAFVFAWRRRASQPLWLLLVLLGLVHLLLPFLFEYTLIKGEMRRAFYEATSIFALMLGVIISERWLASPRVGLKWMGWIIIGSTLFSGTMYLFLRGVIPTMRWEAAPLFAGLPQASAEQQQLYDWVRTHTSQKDFFYVRNLTTDFEKEPDEVAQMRDRVLFMTYTGRFTIGPIIFWDYPKEWLANVLDAERTCGKDVMHRLHARYLLVETADRAAWFRTTCTLSNWSIVYDGGSAFPRVYELAP